MKRHPDTTTSHPQTTRKLQLHRESLRRLELTAVRAGEGFIEETCSTLGSRPCGATNFCPV